MKSPAYSDTITVGGVWPGFDDTLAGWGQDRYMWRRCGQTWVDTWGIAEEFKPPIVMIDTWNDFEEGTDIEYGIGECLSPPQEIDVHLGLEAVSTYMLTNTGKFTDVFKIDALSPNGSDTIFSADSITLSPHASTIFSTTLSTTPRMNCGQSLWGIRATSVLSNEVGNNVSNVVSATCRSYLPIVLKIFWKEYFDPMRDTWSEDTVKWTDHPGPTATAEEDNPDADFGKSESEVITHHVNEHTIFRVKATHVDPSSSYTIQIHDRKTNTDVNIFTGITAPGENAIHIADKMGWENGSQEFTINVWISGEGKSTTFEYIGFEENRLD